MVWASTDIIPTKVSWNCFFSKAANSFNPLQVTISAVSSTGEVFDFSSATTLFFSVTNNLALPPSLSNYVNESITPDLADATQIAVELESSIVLDLAGFMGLLIVPISIYAADEDNTQLLIAVGTVTTNLLP